MINGLADSGKRFMDRVPLMQTIGDKIADGMEAVPARLNLPSKKDIDTLTSTMKTLNRKVAALSRQ
jgi:polyhydroxyalkanoate synthesis regulator phasin